jgi:hypothetical protein
MKRIERNMLFLAIQNILVALNIFVIIEPAIFDR